MATENYLISKDQFENLLKKAEQLDRTNVQPKKTASSSSSKRHKFFEEENISSPEVTVDPTSTNDDDDDDDDYTSETSHADGLALKWNGAHVTSISGDYEYIPYDEYDMVDILKLFDEDELNYIQPILEKIERYEDFLNWDKETGEIIFQSKVVPGSNIVELLKDTIKGGLHPQGKTEFYLGLGSINLKAKYIKNLRNKHLLQIHSRNSYGRSELTNDLNQVKKCKWVDL